jgi:hypothetical protein
LGFAFYPRSMNASLPMEGRIQITHPELLSYVLRYVHVNYPEAISDSQLNITLYHISLEPVSNSHQGLKRKAEGREC